MYIIEEVKELYENEEYIYVIRELYYEFLRNYKKLNDTFDFKKPYDIANFYSYLLHNGYLSCDKEIVFDDKNVLDTTLDVDGANVLAGEALCRHTSRLMSCIYNNQDKSFDADSIPSFIYDENDMKTKLVKIKNYLQYLLLLGVTKDSYVEKIANHEITKVICSNGNIYVDSLNDAIMIPKTKNPSQFISTKGYYALVGENDIATGNVYGYNEYFESKKRVKNITKANEDILERFYHDNSVYYEDIKEYIKMIKKQKKY